MAGSGVVEIETEGTAFDGPRGEHLVDQGWEGAVGGAESSVAHAEETLRSLTGIGRLALLCQAKCNTLQRRTGDGDHVRDVVSKILTSITILDVEGPGVDQRIGRGCRAIVGTECAWVRVAFLTRGVVFGWNPEIAASSIEGEFEVLLILALEWCPPSISRLADTDLWGRADAQLDEVALLGSILGQRHAQVAIRTAREDWRCASLSREIQLQRLGGRQCRRRQKRQAGELANVSSHIEKAEDMMYSGRMIYTKAQYE